MDRSTNISSKIDWVLILLFVTIVGLGYMNLYSSDFKTDSDIGFFSNTYGRQLIWVGASLIIALFIMIVDSVVYSMLAYIIYVSVIGILVLVFIIGAATHGAKSWIEIGNLKIQPSELAKFATALALSKYLSTNSFRLRFKNAPNILITIAIIVTPIVLILIQPDVGSALVYIAFILVLFREGLPGIFLWLILFLVVVFVFSLLISPVLLMLIITSLALIAMYFTLNEKNEIIRIVIAATAIFSFLYFLNLLFSIDFKLLHVILTSIIVWSLYLTIYFFRKRFYVIFIVIGFLFAGISMQLLTNYAFNEILQPHHRNRIDVLFDNSIDPKGIGYNLRQSKIAIGSGGWSGKGYLKGTQTKLNFVPEHNTDFIFCTVAEEWGFRGTFVLFILYGLLILRIIYKAERQISNFSRIYGYSVASILFFHFFVNIGMTMGLLPVIGIPLPFFSYGGSSMLGFSILLFIFIKLDTEKDLKI